MSVNVQKQAAKRFREYWMFSRPGSEIRGCQQYWNMLLGEVLEISVQAGKIVGTLYDALLKQYAEPDSPETLKALNKLCVRLVFCFYAEDADIFDKNIFQKLVMATATVDLRRKLLTLFQVLDTPVDKRDKYLELELAAFPYTNGGLRKAHAANDAAVLKAYGWPTDLSEPEIVSRLFDMYAKRTSVSWNGGRDSV